MSTNGGHRRSGERDWRGQEIRAWRDSMGWSQDVLAKRTGLSKPAIHRLETNETELTTDKRNLIAHALGITPAELDHLPPHKRNWNEPPATPASDPPQLFDRPSQHLVETIMAAVTAALDVWQLEEARHKWENREQYRAELIRRILDRAGRSGPMMFNEEWVEEGGKWEHYSVISDPSDIVRLAIRLVGQAGMNSPTDEQRAAKRDALLITWRGVTDPIGAVPDVYLRQQWVGALRTALARGWYCKHCIEFAPEEASDLLEEKALRSAINVLALHGPTGRYSPSIYTPLSRSRATPEPPHAAKVKEVAPDYVVIPGQGILVLYAPNKAHYYRPSQTRSFERLYKKVEEMLAQSQPLYTSYPRVSPERSDMLTVLEEEPSRRLVLMDGLAQHLMPDEIQQQRYTQLQQILQENGASPEKLRLAEKTFRNRNTRRKVIEDQLSHHDHYDICPKQAIRRLVTEGRTSVNDVDDTFSALSDKQLPELSREQRRVCLTTLLERLRRYSRYHLVLLEDEDPDKVLCSTFFLIKGEQAVLLQFWKQSRDGSTGDPNDQREHVSLLIRNPTVIRAFASSSLWRRYTQDLPSDNKHQAMAFLQQQLNLLR